jgi:hypothetical protein
VTGRDGEPTFHVNEPITIEYSYVNCSDESVRLRYLDADWAKFIVDQWGGDVSFPVWSGAANKSGTEWREQILPPKRRVTLSAVWHDGAPSRGTYSAEASSGQCYIVKIGDCPDGARTRFEVKE